ncbi:MAG TPA: [FeFe] hydrogenase H-cluster radical SAM maturase HydG, partial [bacterium]|nr:[FeFe] hydrogenase H-cluster radical SAM maturase HydG [bacterium]
QVFQETYHRQTYASVHPAGSLKSDYRWRLYSMHRSLEAGIDDVGLGALFGLYDWRFEVLGLLYHARALEKRFGIGPHTISFPRLEPAENTPFIQETGYRVTDEDFRKAVTVIRLSVPYAGMILTAREPAPLRRALLPLGCTQLDASSRIGIGAYRSRSGEQVSDRQQFLLGDTRTLDEVVRELALMGHITSFCTAGYRCGRTGQCIMELLRSGQEGRFCKLNAALTFQEWLDDFATPPTRAAGEPILAREIEDIRQRMPAVFPAFMKQYERIRQGERDLYF